MRAENSSGKAAARGRRGNGERGPLLLLLGLLFAVGCDRQTGAELELEAALEAGRQAISGMRFNEAVAHYERAFRVVQREDARWAEILYGYSLSLYYNESSTVRELRIAHDLMQAVASGAQEERLGHNAQLFLARQHMMAFAEEGGLGDWEQAKEGLLRLMQNDHARELHHEALLRLVELNRMRVDEMPNQDQAMRLLEYWLQQHPSNPLAGLMWQQLGQLRLYHSADKGGALDALMEAAVGHLDHRSGDAAGMLWTTAGLARDLGRHHEAVVLFELLISEYPFSGYRSQAESELEALRKGHGS